MNPVWNTGAILVIYCGGFVATSLLLRRILVLVDPSLRDGMKLGLDFRDIGLWIGLCEYFIVVTFVYFGEFTGIGILFAAKELVRTEKIRERPSYYLLGTLLNISFALFFGLLLRMAL